MSKFKYQQDEIVAFKVGTICGIGKVVGTAMSEQPIIGTTYIVEDLSGALPNEEYPFRCIVCPECQMNKADKGKIPEIQG